MKEEKVNELMDLKKHYKHQGRREFIFPGMLSASSEMSCAFDNFRSPLHNKGKFAKVMFKIKIDDTGVKDKNDGNKITIANCILLNGKLSLNPNGQVMMAMPKFKFSDDTSKREYMMYDESV